MGLSFDTDPIFLERSSGVSVERRGRRFFVLFRIKVFAERLLFVVYFVNMDGSGALRLVWRWCNRRERNGTCLWIRKGRSGLTQLRARIPKRFAFTPTPGNGCF